METNQHAFEQPIDHRKIKKGIKIFIGRNENENTATQNLWGSVKAVLRGRFIAIQAYLQNNKRNKK